MRDETEPFDRATWRENWDWQEAFAYGKDIRTATGCSNTPFGIGDVADVIAADPGENDSQSWMMAGKLKDGRFFFLDAWCDYTGWDCQAGGDGQVADTLDNLIRFGMTKEARERLKFPEPE
jgi:hypothetical protein